MIAKRDFEHAPAIAADLPEPSKLVKRPVLWALPFGTALYLRCCSDRTPGRVSALRVTIA